MTAVDPPQSGNTRELLIGAILEFLVGQDLLTMQDIRAALEHEIDAAGPGSLVGLRERLSVDRGWDYYPPDPLVRRIHHMLADRFLRPESAVRGSEHLARVAQAPVAILSNHLSYADANVIEVLLQRSGAETLASRLTAIAGPKVFSSRQRRFSSLCFGTVKAPQSTEVSSGEAVLNSREVARAARRAIDVAHSRLAAGDALLIFGEGTRSRTRQMQPMLAAVARYLDAPGTWVLPMALTGPDQLFPIDGAMLRPAQVVMQIGCPFPADALLSAAGGDRRVAMDAIGLAISRLLPDSFRGVYAAEAEFARARQALSATLTAAL